MHCGPPMCQSIFIYCIFSLHKRSIIHKTFHKQLTANKKHNAKEILINS